MRQLSELLLQKKQGFASSALKALLRNRALSAEEAKPRNRALSFASSALPRLCFFCASSAEEAKPRE
jgi:hypothetical protein